MKKATILLLATTAISSSVFAQSSKWFVSVNSGMPFGGPGASIKNNMRKSGLNSTYISPGGTSYGFFTMVWPEHRDTYPKCHQHAPLLVRVGKKISSTRSVSIAAGVSNSGSVEGFKRTGRDPASGDTRGIFLEVKYKVVQFTAGYQFSFANSGAKLTLGPSLFLLHYQTVQGSLLDKRKTAVEPGIAASARLPLGKEKHLFGIDLIADFNLAARSKMIALTSNNNYPYGHVAVLKSGTVNMINGMLGLALSFRK